MKTEKLYYENLFQQECSATIIGINGKGVILDQTVAFPEGGGQQGDKGILLIENNEETLKIPFLDTQKGGGKMLDLEGFPVIEVNNPIYHVVENEDMKLLKIGSNVKVKIDVERRAKLTVAHSGIHVVLMAIEKINPNFSQRIKGASISEEHARLDFFTEEKFSADCIERINEYVLDIAKAELPIELYSHPNEKEARYWKCKDSVYPCGGTHLLNTKYLGNVKVKRKGLGKTLERIQATFEFNKLPIALYN